MPILGGNKTKLAFTDYRLRSTCILAKLDFFLLEQVTIIKVELAKSYGPESPKHVPRLPVHDQPQVLVADIDEAAVGIR